MHIAQVHLDERGAKPNRETVSCEAQPNAGTRTTSQGANREWSGRYCECKQNCKSYNATTWTQVGFLSSESVSPYNAAMYCFVTVRPAQWRGVWSNARGILASSSLSKVPARGPFFYVDQSLPTQVALADGSAMHLQHEHLYTFLNGAAVDTYQVSTGVGGSTPIRSGNLGTYDRGKILRQGDPGWIVQGGVYVDNFWPLFPDGDRDSQILIHTLPFHPYADGTHDPASYYGQAALGSVRSSAGCIRMWPAHTGHFPGFGHFTTWSQTMQSSYGPIPFTIGA
jgi:hypothetical protein